MVQLMFVANAGFRNGWTGRLPNFAKFSRSMFKFAAGLDKQVIMSVASCDTQAFRHPETFGKFEMGVSEN